jgi:SNF2 family DNA or RNA helicase
MNITESLRQKVEQRTLELFEKGHTNDDINNIDIRNDIMRKLLPHQVLHTFNMISAISNKKNRSVIDGSSTGTGKTYTTAAACAQLKLHIFVICPKSIINVWRNVLKLFNVTCISVVNYEMIKALKYIDEKECKVNCPYIKMNNNTFEWDFSSYSKIHPSININNDIVVIFDEVHRCKKHTSLNGKLLLSCKKLKTIMLSASLCDKTSDFGIFGTMLGFYKNFRQGKGWLESVMRQDKNSYNNDTNTLHKYLFPNKGSKMSMEDLGDAFPMNQISMECYNLDGDTTNIMNQYYKQIVGKINEHDYKHNASKLIEINAMRQKIENLKVDILIDMMISYYEQNKSVAVFVNYVSTYDIIIQYLSKRKYSYAEINGTQDEDDRTENINKFQSNETKIIVCMIQTGGVSINLHDVTPNGSCPRVSIISPSYSCIELVQTLGRIARVGSKSPCVQKIVYCADTYEEEVAKFLRTKLQTLDKITDDDMNVENIVIKNDNNKCNNNIDVKCLKNDNDRITKHKKDYNRAFDNNDNFYRKEIQYKNNNLFIVG